MIRPLALAILSLLSTPKMLAQLLPDRLDSAPAHVRHAPAAGQLPAGMIDGSKNPEQIPDSTAYRLFLITVAEESIPTSEQRARQIAILRSAGLDDSDVNNAIPVLADFKTQYRDLIARYNKSIAEANANGEAPDVKSFLHQRDLLVQGTRDALAVALSANGVGRLHTHVQREKSRMKVTAKEGQ